ncbi:MAG: FAD-binding oxidoreductase [Methylococcales bacterium]
MPTITYQGNEYPGFDGETVLDTFLRHGVKAEFSCRNGVCQVCMLRTANATIPADAQTGLRKSLVERDYFLACKYAPEADLEVNQPRAADLFNRAVVYKKELLTPDICRLLLDSATELYYHAGQFINIRRDDGLLRSYSLASVPYLDVHLELHIKRIPDGKMSNWIFDELKEGDELEFQGSNGTSYYCSGNSGQNILMVGTGTGLAPLIGIIRDALYSNHTGEIHLYHGSRYRHEVYLQDTLFKLSEKFANFHYTQCVSSEKVPTGGVTRRACQTALVEHPDLKGWRVYLCGTPGMVHSMRENVQALGVDANDIHIDPFEFSKKDIRDVDNEVSDIATTNSAQHDQHRSQSNSNFESGRKPIATLKPDVEMWAALKNGELLTRILDDFYTQVYADPLLKPYFEDVTKDWVAQKQYSFLRQLFTGEKVYLGNNPRNAHHWMVISDELFEYRENIMLECLRGHGLDEHFVARWRAMEESYRKDIVKRKPWNKIIDGKEIATEGYKELTLEMATVCDHCLKSIEAGEVVRYHVRLASVYCPSCMGKTAANTEPALPS